MKQFSKDMVDHAETSLAETSLKADAPTGSQSGNTFRSPRRQRASICPVTA